MVPARLLLSVRSKNASATTMKTAALPLPEAAQEENERDQRCPRNRDTLNSGRRSGARTTPPFSPGQAVASSHQCLRQGNLTMLHSAKQSSSLQRSARGLATSMLPRPALVTHSDVRPHLTCPYLYLIIKAIRLPRFGLVRHSN